MHDPREGLDADGTIRTGAHRSRVPPAFDPVLAAALDSFDDAAAPGAELHLYGSVANGTALLGHSDVDLLAIDTPHDWSRELSERLTREFADRCRGVEVGRARRDDLLAEGDEAYGNRIFLRHYCIPLSQRDDLRSPTPFRGDARAARGFNGDIGSCLARWRTSPPRPRIVARKTLFAAASVVSIMTGTWTTDREIAVRRWRDIEPDRAHEIALLHGWAEDDHSASAADLGAALAPAGIVANVVDHFEGQIGLWS